jgi:citrate synthase
LSRQAFWDYYRGKIRTKKGGWRIGRAIYNHGYSMMDDLVGKKSYFQVLVLNATGRLPERRIADWLEALFICLSWSDPRIWCNQLGSLGGTMRATPPASIAAGILAADSRMYASGVIPACCRFIRKAREMQLAGASVADIVAGELSQKSGIFQHSKPVISGYARPIATGDERVVAMRRVGQDLGFEPGPHELLALAIHDELYQHYSEGINVAGYCVAVLCDLGFSDKEQYLLFSTWVHSGIHACYAEAAERPAEAFLPLRCDDIEYCGVSPRPLTNSDKKRPRRKPGSSSKTG